MLLTTEMIAIGDELLKGDKQEKNGLALASLLEVKGFSLSKISVVPDSEDLIKKALKAAISSSHLLILSGGIGPTRDDITKKILADFFDLPLTPSSHAQGLVKKHYGRISRSIPSSNSYHVIPKGFTPVFNSIGLAPGLRYENKTTFLLAAPGVPREFQAMLKQEISPWLEKYRSISVKGEQITIRTRGIPEETIFFEMDSDLWKNLSSLGKVASLPRLYGVDIVLSQIKDKKETLKKLDDLLHDHPLSSHIWQIGSVPLNEWVIQKAVDKNLTLALAESCTGGLLASKLTDVPGSSQVFKGGVISYSNFSKQKLLQVKENTLKAHGPCSKETVIEMAQTIRKQANTSMALAVSGVTGPDKLENIPVGTLALGLATDKEQQAWISTSHGDRIQLKERFTQIGLHTLLDVIEKNSNEKGSFMLIILSPAKKMDFSKPTPVIDKTQPIFMKKTWKLVSLLKKKDASFLASLMKLSDQLAELNNQRYKDFTKTPQNAKQALFVFNGDVYRGLNIESFKKKDITYAQKHLRILSGLYGLLSPLDLIQPYRLEMGVKFSVDKHKDLYGYWKESLTKEIQRQLEKHKYLINLASKEYSSVIDFSSIDRPVITPVFKEKRKGAYKIIGLFAKKARGMLTRHILLKRMKTLEDIKKFDEEGYRFNKDLSSSFELVFCR